MTWKCPKCGREFGKKDRDHYCVKPRTIDEYIAAQDESVGPGLERLRSVIREAVPDPEEELSWPMPAFWKGRNLICVASFREQIGLYPGEEDAFARRFAGFEISKGTIRLPHDRDLPEKLIADTAKWCYAAYANRQAAAFPGSERTLEIPGRGGTWRVSGIKDMFGLNRRQVG